MSVGSTVSDVEWLARELSRLEGATIAHAVRRALLDRPSSPYDEQDYEVRKVEARLAAIAALPAREGETDRVARDRPRRLEDAQA